MSSSNFKELFSDPEEADAGWSSVRLDAITKGMWVPGNAVGRRLTVPTLARLNSGLTLPEGVQQMPRPAPIDYVGPFVSLKDYLSPSQMPGGSPESVVEQVIS